MDRNKRSQIAKILLTLVLLANMTTMIPVAQAQTCADLADPAKTKEWIVTIVEEQIVGSPSQQAQQGQTGDTVIKDCLRVTTCTGEGAERKCTSQYQDLGSCASGNICQRVQVFFAKSGAGLLYSYIGLIYRWSAGVIGIVCVLFLIVGGVQIATAGDNAGAIDSAKQRIIRSLAGLVLLFLSAVILYTINPNFFTV